MPDTTAIPLQTKLMRYRDDPNYGNAGAFANRVDWIATMHANTVDAAHSREFMVRLISLLECDVPDSVFEKRVFDVLRVMANPSGDSRR